MEPNQNTNMQDVASAPTAINTSLNTPSASADSSRPGNDVVFQDKPKKNTGVILTIVLLVLLAVGGIGFGVWAMMDGNQREDQLNQQISNLKTQNNELQDKLLKIDNENSNNNQVSDSGTYCVGTYYGEASGTLSSGLAYDYKYKYVLDDSGGFTADFGGVSGAKGFYVINGNTISLISERELTGSDGEATQYATKDYVIADDCSYIKVFDDGGVSFMLNKQ